MTPVELVKKLFTEHFYRDESGNFQWGYVEGIPLRFLDPDMCEEVERLLTLSDEDKPV